METAHYLNKFNACADKLDQSLFDAAGLAFKVGEWRDSVVLKIQKPSWRNDLPKGKPFEQSIFFSIWVSDEDIKQNRLCYNIHALKLRELTHYKIQSREFAAAFRQKFKLYEKDWPNVSTAYGPLTLMEGWVSLDDLDTQLPKLAHAFLKIAYIIDELLTARRK